MDVALLALSHTGDSAKILGVEVAVGKGRENVQLAGLPKRTQRAVGGDGAQIDRADVPRNVAERVVGEDHVSRAIRASIVPERVGRRGVEDDATLHALGVAQLHQDGLAVAAGLGARVRRGFVGGFVRGEAVEIDDLAPRKIRRHEVVYRSA